MRQLNTQELITVSGAGKAAALPADPIAAITAALAAKGITIALDKTAGTLTVTSPKGTKVFTLPKLPTHTMPAAPAATDDTATA
jgi:hypothetical protein